MIIISCLIHVIIIYYNQDESHVLHIWLCTCILNITYVSVKILDDYVTCEKRSILQVQRHNSDNVWTTACLLLETVLGSCKRKGGKDNEG